MSTRREAREWALQLLFQLDFNPADPTELAGVMDAFWAQQWRLLRDEADEQSVVEPPGDDRPPADRVAPVRLRDFVERLVRGVWGNRDEIDRQIMTYAENWPLHRMGSVDRNVLRLAIYEMFHSRETPPVVCINEAVDLAKFFSSSDSGRFVNGILDRACRDVKRPTRTSAGARGGAKPGDPA